LGLAFSFLEPLLLRIRKSQKSISAELSEILRPEGMDAFNPEGIVRAEYSILKKSLQFRLRKTRAAGLQTHSLDLPLGKA